MDLVESVIVGAASGLAPEAVRFVVAAVRASIGGGTEAAQRHAAENTMRFLHDLSERVAYLEGHAGISRDELVIPASLEGALDDPDFVVSMRLATIAAARSSDPRKHRALAGAVAQRLQAPADSPEAVTAAVAIEAIPRLSTRHLDLLGALTFVHLLRPEGIPLTATAPDDLPLVALPDGRTVPRRASDTEVERLVGYADWFGRGLEVHGVPDDLSEADAAHLASTNTIIFERHVQRDLEKVLTPYGGRALSLSEVRAFRESWGVLESSKRYARLRRAWVRLLQQLTLTPPGALIGAAVHEVRAGELLPVNWGVYREPGAEAAVANAPWDGRRLTRGFREAIEREVVELLRRLDIRRG